MGGYRPILLVGLVLVRRVPKLVVPVLRVRVVDSEFFVPVFYAGWGGTGSGRVKGRLIIIFEIVVPVLGRSALGRGNMNTGALFLDRTRGSPRLINEVIVPVLGHIALFENAFGRRHSRIGTVEVEILVPILGVAGCGSISEENVREGFELGNEPASVWTAAAICAGEHTLETPCGRPSVEVVYACFAGRRGGRWMGLNKSNGVLKRTLRDDHCRCHRSQCEQSWADIHTSLKSWQLPPL